MEADIEYGPRDQEISRREKRWSMNSQRLEEIVAELMKPISDIRRNFDTDISALLEEYLTEAGLHALEAEGQGEGAAVAPPNFVELALLLQQSASIYGRKVDFLYEHVLSVSEDLHNNAESPGEGAAAAAAAGAGGAGGGRGRRRRASGGPPAWGPVRVPPGPARRPPSHYRPPPTLPRTYAELEPRAPSAADVPLLDRSSEPIGLAADFHVTWRLHKKHGTLLEDLESSTSTGVEVALRSVPVVELLAALEARANSREPADATSATGLRAPASLSATVNAADPPPPPPAAAASLSTPGDAADSSAPGYPWTSSAPGGVTRPAAAAGAMSPSVVGGAPSPSEPLHCSTPLWGPNSPPPASGPLRLLKNERKRKTELHSADAVGQVKLLISEELRLHLSRQREFSVPAAWRRRVVRRRAAQIRARRLLLPERAPLLGFDFGDVGGFLGWTEDEVRATQALVRRDSDDDGFFERSSFEESAEAVGAEAPGAEAPGEAVDVRALAAATLGALPPAPRAAPFAGLLRARARRPGDVSRLLLATLFLANAGNVLIEPPPPLALGGFSLRVASLDASLYCAAAAAEPQLR